MAERRKKVNNNNDPHWRLPLTIDALAYYGALDVPYSDEPFNPNASWLQVWEIWLLRPNIKESNHHGFVSLEKHSAQGANVMRLSVTQQVIEQHSLTTQKADITCLKDTYATPIRWTKNFDVHSFDSSEAIQRTGFDKEGLLQGNRLIDGTTQKNIGTPVTSNWCLPDVLQRLSVNGKTELPSFTLLDELEKIKEDQRIRLLGERKIPFCGRQVAVKYYQHTGRGMLPYFYYVDLHGRLLVAISGLQAFILNPEAQTLTEKLLHQR